MIGEAHPTRCRHCTRIRVGTSPSTPNNRHYHGPGILRELASRNEGWNGACAVDEPFKVGGSISRVPLRLSCYDINEGRNRGGILRFVLALH